MNDQPIKIAIADDHKLMRGVLIDMLNSLSSFKIIIEATNGLELIEKLNQAAVLPDVCLLDISMPQKNGYETMKEIKKNFASIRVLILSMFETDYSVLQMLKLGAKGYLSKNFSSSEQLSFAVKSVYENGFFYSETVSQKTFSALNKGNEVPKISEQEMAFLKYSCLDKSYEEIAKIMGISKRTVEGYRDSLFLKLDIKSRNSLSIFAIQNGLVSLSEIS